MIMEYFSPKHRGVAACVLEVFWGMGVFILALIAYLIRDWRWMQRCFSLLILLTLFYVWQGIFFVYIAVIVLNIYE